MTLNRPIQVMIVGAEKAGTSSLARYLGQHPNVCTHKQQEMNYFIVDKEYVQGYDKCFRTYFCRCLERDAVILGKSAGLMYSPKSMRRLWEHNADVHLIVILRNPIERAYSAYWYAKRMGREYHPTFEEWISAAPARLQQVSANESSNGYLERGLYEIHLGNLYRHFSKDRVHIFLYDDFKRDSFSICSSIMNSLGLSSDVPLDTSVRFNEAAAARFEWLARSLESNSRIKNIVRQFIPNSFAHYMRNKMHQLNKGSALTPPMASETRECLVKYFKPHNAQLSALLDRDLSHWDR